MEADSLPNLLWKARLALRHMSDDLFEKTIHDLSEERGGHDRIIQNQNAIFKFAVDFSNDIWLTGDHFVYAYVSEDGELFYVGQGNIERVMNCTNRSDKFKKLFKSKMCKPFILASFVNCEQALFYETRCIEIACLAGSPLTNVQKKIKSSKAIEKSLTEEDYDSYGVDEAMFCLLRYCDELKLFGKEAV